MKKKIDGLPLATANLQKPLSMETTIRERQWGNAMTTEQFEKKLRFLNPNLRIEPHPHFSSKGCLWLQLPNGNRELISPCERPVMPEWSIMVAAPERRPADADNPRGVWKPYLEPRYEAKRGWRTILLRLLHKNLISLELAELHFGSGIRESWHQLTGKAKTVHIQTKDIA